MADTCAASAMWDNNLHSDPSGLAVGNLLLQSAAATDWR